MKKEVTSLILLLSLASAVRLGVVHSDGSSSFSEVPWPGYNPTTLSSRMRDKAVEDEEPHCEVLPPPPNATLPQVDPTDAECPVEKQVLMMEVLVDTAFFEANSEDMESTLAEVQFIYDKVNEHYCEAFNLYINVRSVIVAEERGTPAWNAPNSKNDQINLITNYYHTDPTNAQRREDLNIGAVQMLWDYASWGGIVGLAYVGQTCKTWGVSWVVMSGSIETTIDVATHELGHTMGAVHDGASNYQNRFGDCRGEDSSRYFMAPYASRHHTEFSDCSQEHICGYMKLFNCLEDANVCGNGVCGSAENFTTCPADCVPVCGDGVCEVGEHCPDDCDVASPTHHTVTVCDGDNVPLEGFPLEIFAGPLQYTALTRDDGTIEIPNDPTLGTPSVMADLPAIIPGYQLGSMVAHRHDVAENLILCFDRYELNLAEVFLPPREPHPIDTPTYDVRVYIPYPFQLISRVSLPPTTTRNDSVTYLFPCDIGHLTLFVRRYNLQEPINTYNPTLWRTLDSPLTRIDHTILTVHHQRMFSVFINGSKFITNNNGEVHLVLETNCEGGPGFTDATVTDSSGSHVLHLSGSVCSVSHFDLL